jgi:hypothetical protein
MRDKGLATAVATLLAAFATAHLMQFGMSAGRALSGTEMAVPIGLATLVAQRGGTPSDEVPPGPRSLPRAVPTSDELRLPVARDLPDDSGVPVAVSRGAQNGFGLPCERRLTVAAEPGGMLRIGVHAACDAGVRVEIRHAGVSFAHGIAADGRLSAAFPAMMVEADVEAIFADGTAIGSRINVPDADRVQRVALASDAWAALSLQALEFGARWGGTGHVYLGAESTRTGALHRLGDIGIEAPRIAEVYTFPAGRFGSPRDVRFLVEAEVTPANCGRDVAADLLRSSEGGRAPVWTPVRLAMPSCEAAGDILVIELPLSDLRIARN